MAEELEYIVETDFLFGLRPSDRLHDCVVSILRGNIEGEVRLSVSGASPIEANAVMASQGLVEDRIGEAFSLIGATLRKYRVRRYTSITVPDVEDASSLRRRLRGLTFFDSLHASISGRLKVPILSSDPIYRDLEVEWVDLRDMA